MPRWSRARLRQLAELRRSLSARGVIRAQVRVRCCVQCGYQHGCRFRSTGRADTHAAMPRIEAGPAMDVVVGALAAAEPGPASCCSRGAPRPRGSDPPPDLLRPCPSRCYLCCSQLTAHRSMDWGRVVATTPGPRALTRSRSRRGKGKVLPSP